ncbi:hypothetical protein [Synechococcus sp. HIMB2401]|uniref:hypothetical protein n=1 Tax=Synechococcus sp. HIMB2401 TaxID=3144208 RepID=UPI0036F1FA34
MKGLLLTLGVVFFSMPVGAHNVPVEMRTTMKVCLAINDALYENSVEGADRRDAGASKAELTHIQEKRDRLHEAWDAVCQNHAQEL